MKKSTKELVEAFNILRLQYAGETITGEELSKQLKLKGFDAKIIALLKKNKEIFSSKREFSKPKMFSFKENPLYIGQLTAIIQQTKKPKGAKEEKFPFTEEEAVRFLKSRGYRLQKEVGLNIEAIRKENPEMFEKYLILHEV